MSNGGNAALALALGAGGGLLWWHLTKKDGKKKPGGPSGAPAVAAAPSPVPSDGAVAPASSPPETSAAPAAVAPPVVVTPPPASWPCMLKLDGAGLTVNGDRADVTSAVTRCKAAGRAELALAGSAPAALHAQLAYALFNAGVPLQTRAA